MKTIKKNTGTWGDDFHVFTVVWKPGQYLSSLLHIIFIVFILDQITVSVDDTVYGNIYAPPKGFVSESHNLELGNVERWSSGTPFAPFDKEVSCLVRFQQSVIFIFRCT